MPFPGDGDGRRGGYGGGETVPGRAPEQEQEQAQAAPGLDLGEHTLADLLGSIFVLTRRQLSGRGPV
ncbi:hypothetical protein ACIQVL_41770 [Streptomyces sp. NPDC090499]|uniref:hypothetical protein n=1 Tax=Streptomyces sp. NPDC090499 TaxID=3365965 RepID=UPI0037F9BC34